MLRDDRILIATWLGEGMWDALVGEPYREDEVGMTALKHWEDGGAGSSVLPLGVMAARALGRAAVAHARQALAGPRPPLFAAGAMVDHRAMGAGTPPRILVTIPISHYCEKARWALDRAGLAYDEQRHLPGLHRFAVRRAGGRSTAPVLVCETGVLAESAEIVAFADARTAPDRRMALGDPAAAAEARALSASFDGRLGPHSRRWVYHGLSGRRDLVTAFGTTGVPTWQRRSFGLTYAAVMFTINRVLDITPETAAQSEREVLAVFDEVDARLADGRAHLVGGRFSEADLTFAALAAPLVMPPEYGVPLPPLDAMPARMAATIRELRARPAGAHALAMFHDERR